MAQIFSRFQIIGLQHQFCCYYIVKSVAALLRYVCFSVISNTSILLHTEELIKTKMAITYICVLYLKLYKARTPFGEIFIHFQSLCVRSVGSWPLRCPVLSFKMNSHPGVIFTLQVILIAISGTQAQGLRILQGIYVYIFLFLHFFESFRTRYFL